MTTFHDVPRERVWFDAKARAALAEELRLRGASRALALVSATLNRPGAAGSTVLDGLGDLVAARYDGLSEHTPLPRVLEAAALARATRADALIAIGGGSVLDGAKAVKAALAANISDAGGFSDYSLANSNHRGVPAGGPPLIVAPTTLSAAEYSCRAGYTNPESGLKEGVRALTLAPASVILDPDLCRHTPLRLWLSSGIRAVDHAVEGICARGAWPGLRAQAATGLGMLAKGLRATAINPDDRDALSVSQQGVWLISAMCEQVPMGASHGLGYLLGLLGRVPHGLTSCVLLPAVMRFNADACSEAMAVIADALGATDASDAIEQLIAALGLPTRLSALDVSQDALDRIARLAVIHPVVRANPEPLVALQDVRALLDSAL